MFITLEDESADGLRCSRETADNAGLLGTASFIYSRKRALTAGRGDGAKRGSSGLDSREPRPPIKPRDMYEPDLHIDNLKIRARNFR
jgi:hypothetical protein